VTTYRSPRAIARPLWEVRSKKSSDFRTWVIAEPPSALSSTCSATHSLVKRRASSQATARPYLEASSALTAKSALQRLLEPAEVAAAVAFLCSDATSAVNGQTLVIDGGEVQR
jgi:NAD(P)-dependent dehydrogenase (short-subunit alcohol dehydrogenase family)